ncbi:MAG: hypothetical protein CEE42_06210 [Promethearchaeota archaeon Loki_b31]|nr:MAG: hypothetical protein CEE42_06210 [Candidatus Lokiarchaeota archaeon Loki_b31]
MKIEHLAVSSNSEEDSDNFFIKLLGLKKLRSFVVSSDLMEQFFKVKNENKVIRYGNEGVSVEVFITDDKSKALDKFTHMCLVIEDRAKLIDIARQMNYEVIKVPRKNSDVFYLFLKDKFGNLYEIK